MTGIFLDGTNLVPAEKMTDDIDRVVQRLTVLNRKRPKMPVHKLLEEYRSLTERLMTFYDFQCDLMKGYNRVIDQLRGAGATQSHKRWTDEEDEALIEFATRSDENMISLATHFNRTPGAVSSRLTYLVGVRRLSRYVAGRLIGYLDGEPVDGVIHGEVTPVTGKRVAS